MIGDSSEAWQREIRDYLLGRLSLNQDSVPLGAIHRHELVHAPIRRWWTFEGKRYPSIDGTLSASWSEAIRAAMRLQRTFNPRLRISERPDGTVDWGYTLARGPSGPSPEPTV